MEIKDLVEVIEEWSGSFHPDCMMEASAFSRVAYIGASSIHLTFPVMKQIVSSGVMNEEKAMYMLKCYCIAVLAQYLELIYEGENELTLGAQKGLLPNCAQDYIREGLHILEVYFNVELLEDLTT